ncbi:MAG TPA: FAD-binding oxidoreductase [Acidimicrobiales bacterium]|nr:FAD-binding oxidoreductase [Acidimicrobiales bacterium]HLN42300.1 FAD-binding oxidoreductase [Acidimicrobiales bacterium]
MSGASPKPYGVPTTRQTLTGWGRTAPSACDVAQVRSGLEVDRLVSSAAESGQGIVARGLARSYGDAAQCAGGIVIDTTGLDGVLDFDPGAGLVRVGSGTSIDALLRAFVPRGWFVPVTPGTRYVTVGGAIAADIHGKNHHRDGSFCSYVTRLSLATPSGRLEISPERDPELFWATAGGMGMTGAVVEATLRMLPVETAIMMVDTERAANLDDCMERMARRDAEYRYSVAWIDCLARGAKLGRAVLTRADHARLADLPTARRGDALCFAPQVRAQVPATPPPGLLNPLTVAAFNEFWFRKAPRARTGELQAMAAFFHPLDGVGAWNRLYGPWGMVQYQFVVPFGAEDSLLDVLRRLSEGRVASFLAVLKRFGDADPGPLSFPVQGWTLALDMPVGPPGLGPLLDALDEIVAGAGGRVYLAKDSRLRPEMLKTMYPRLPEWRVTRDRVDPGGTFVSDLARRLGLVSMHSPLRASRRGRSNPGPEEDVVR